MFKDNKEQISFQELWEIKNRLISYKDEFIAKRCKRLAEFQNLSAQKIAEKFSFCVMQKEYPEFCVLLGKNKLCHSPEGGELNCYCCVCPNYEIEISLDNEKNLYKVGLCKINSSFGQYKLTHTRTDKPKDYLIWNCVNCNIPHDKAFVEKIVKKDLKY